MPTSVLLAVLAGAGLLALAPALVRRYDADERIAADREQSKARVLERNAKGRTGPGATPINGPSEDGDSAESDVDETQATEPDSQAPNALRTETPVDDETVADEPEAESPRRAGAWERTGARRAESVTWTPNQTKPHPPEEAPMASAQLRTWWQQRHRRVLYVLLLLTLVELVGVIVVGPGFWVGVAVSVALLVAFLRFLRLRAIKETKQRRTRRPAIAEKRQVYVPPQAEGTELEPVEPTDAPDGLVPGFGEPTDEPVEKPEAAEPDVAEPPSRRRTGGIRGRSYESPANL
ncbi:hypothetical protein FB566_3310 [Stackebrandtia endophytica]|uniref:Uncharacterized protein n=1 Tax=Stackebrandtia endophytica TaxID=1496996 RepID=A0A543AYU7_9ACTN|nr:hypothetical protein [Stackebrandtia endophytica]TQL77746.1 hypothetical protein FB566_3310 [Stackebrandtia endophytica]